MKSNKITDLFRDELAYIQSLAQDAAMHDPEFSKFISASENQADLLFLYEHFAYLMAKIRFKVEDGFPEITHNVLTRVFPTPLRPLPSTTILRFEPSSQGEIHQFKRGMTVDNGKLVDKDGNRFSGYSPYFSLINGEMVITR